MLSSVWSGNKEEKNKAEITMKRAENNGTGVTRSAGGRLCSGVGISTGGGFT